MAKVYRDITCAVCQSTFQHWMYHAKYCSKKCFHQSIYHKSKKVVLNKGYTLMKRYGITLEQYQAMNSAQNSCCALCSREDSNLYVDHCHKTGQVRKLLCKQCNMALGLIKEDIRTLQNMIDYVNEFETSASNERGNNDSK